MTKAEAAAIVAEKMKRLDALHEKCVEKHRIALVENALKLRELIQARA